MLLPIPSAINRLPIWNARYAPFFQWYLNTHNINPSPGNCTYFLKWAPRFRSRKCNFCFQFFCHLGQPKTLHKFILWYGRVVWWLCWHRTILMIKQNNIGSFHLCMISGNRNEAWPIYHVWPISELKWSGATWPACCHWPNPGRVDGRCPVMFVLTQSYPCDAWFVRSILRELAVSNLGQLLFCLSITWSRCRNAYRDLWIMTHTHTHTDPIHPRRRWLNLLNCGVM